MAITFDNIDELKTYINNYIKSNGVGSITGPQENNIGIALADFIVSYGINTTKGDIASTGGNLLLTKPVTIISGSLPTSIGWQNNIQNQYYIVNTFGVSIPLSDGLSYLNEALISQTTIPALSAVQIMQLENGSWVKVNTATSGSIEIPNQTDTPLISLSGTLDRIINFNISEEEDNAVQILSDGLYVSQSSGSGDVTQVDF